MFLTNRLDEKLMNVSVSLSLVIHSEHKKK